MRRGLALALLALLTGGLLSAPLAVGGDSVQLLRERNAARCAQYDGWACVTQDARTLFTQRRARKPKPTPRPTPTPVLAVYTFRDEFDGAAVDPAKWRLPPGTPLGTEGGTVWNNSHSFVADGLLHLRAVRISPNLWEVPCYDTSRGLFKQRYGILEARIRVPRGNGLWPAFWAISEHGNAEGPWGPSELDMMEILANEPGSNNNGVPSDDVLKVHQVVHWDDATQTHTGTVYAAPLSDDFHVYRVEWRASFIEFQVDGQVTARLTHADQLSGSMVLALNLAVGGWPGPSGVSTPSPAEMLVDWVRVRG